MQITDDQTKAMTTAGLNLIAQALTIYDSNLRLAVCNAPFQQMFDLPDRLVTPGATFRETIHHLATKGEYGEVADIETFVQERVEQARAFEPHYMERTRANGRTISVEGSPLPQGAGSRSTPTSPPPRRRRLCCAQGPVRFRIRCSRTPNNCRKPTANAPR